MAYIVSVDVAEEGVLDLEFAIIVLDNRGNPSGIFIENGQGRTVVDVDGVSDCVENDTTTGIAAMTIEELSNLLSVN